MGEMGGMDGNAGADEMITRGAFATRNGSGYIMTLRVVPVTLVGNIKSCIAIRLLISGAEPATTLAHGGAYPLWRDCFKYHKCEPPSCHQSPAVI
jgi:hypothetical protein